MTNKLTKTRILSITLSLLIAFGILAAGTSVAKAASGPLKAYQPETMYAKETTMGYLDFRPAKANPKDSDWDIPDKCTLVSVKSSNTKVLEAEKDGTSLYNLHLEPKKVGKSTVTVKYKYKGKTYTIRKVCKVKKYPDAIKSLKVNGRSVDLDNEEFRFDYDISEYKKTSAKIKLTPDSGWKIQSVDMTIFNDTYDNYKEIKPSVIKKGTAISCSKKKCSYCVFIHLECTKGSNKGDTFTYNVRFLRY